MLRHLLQFRRSKPAPVRWVPEGTCVYAIGDVHGEVELLRALHASIRADARTRCASRTVVVHLGDYVDRGMASKQVLDYLTGDPLPEFETVFLLGNHDHWFRTFLKDVEVGPSWLANGGNATLHSYGVRPLGDDRLEDLQARLRVAVPERHIAFLEGCSLYHIEGDYLFVHAGLRPGVALADQHFDDFLWIRGEFLESHADHGFGVVHGHTRVDVPEVLSNRIAVDTGACATCVLTALRLEGSEHGFLSTAD